MTICTPMENSTDLEGQEVLPFSQTLVRHSLELTRAETNTLQVNVGLKCNLSCRHCHYGAGPARQELMTRETMDQVIEFSRRVRPEIIDITGGAPELNPDLEYLIEKTAPLTSRIMLRTNLVAISDDAFLSLFKKHGVVVVASFPSTNANQADAQRGSGVFDKSVEMLKKLNQAGYGMPGTGLELNLISNPSGAFLPVTQVQAEKNFKRVLAAKIGISFNQLLTFANVPLGKYYSWLESSGNLKAYLKRLTDAFNPCTIDGLMCRTLLSISWDGFVYDCDFNQAAQLHMGSTKQHISELHHWPNPGSPVVTADHCYACTAGAGFS